MANIHIRNAGQEREEEPMISQKAMKRILEDKDKQYKDMRHLYEERIMKKNSEVALHIHNEKNYERQLKERERLCYVVGVVSSAVGGFIGFICG